MPRADPRSASGRPNGATRHGPPPSSGKPRAREEDSGKHGVAGGRAAKRFFSLTPDTFRPEASAAVALAMRAADEAGIDPQPIPLPLVGGGRAVEAEVEHYRARRHEAERHGPIIICFECGAYVVDQGRNPKLAGFCQGRSKVASTRANERSNISRALRGLHPRTGDPFPVPPGQGPQPPPAAGGGVASG